MIAAILLALILIIIYILHRRNEKYFNYWTERGFPQVKPMFLFGNILNKYFSQDSLGPYFAKIYKKYKRENMKALGFYSFYTPSLLIVDPELIQEILIKDFDSFHDRTVSLVDLNDPLSHHLFNMVGERWRNLRAKLTPAFTTGKLKMMFPVMSECGKLLEEYLTKNVKNNGGQLEIDIIDILTRYNLTLSSSRDFGMVNDCINDPDNLFRKLSLELSHFSLLRKIKTTIFFFAPKLIKYINMFDTEQNYFEYITSMVKDQIESRETGNERRDLMQLLIELMQQGFISVDKTHETHDLEKLTFNEVASQAFLFFLAGYEGSVNTMTYFLFEFCKHPHIQKKLYEEIDRVLEKNEGSLTYEALSEMKYLECCVNETTRKYPIGTPFRLCGKDYQISGTDLIIEKGTRVFFPTLGIQRDPQYYEDPMDFRPERFVSSSTGNNTKGVTFFPFGEGRRQCIGIRLAKLQMKIGLVSLLSKFYAEFTDENMLNKELEFDSVHSTLTPKKRIVLKLTLRELDK